MNNKSVPLFPSAAMTAKGGGVEDSESDPAGVYMAMVNAAPDVPELSNEEIRGIALKYGFSLKLQPDNSHDLHPYVYTFARELISFATSRKV